MASGKARVHVLRWEERQLEDPTWTFITSARPRRASKCCFTTPNSASTFYASRSFEFYRFRAAATRNSSPRVEFSPWTLFHFIIVLTFEPELLCCELLPKWLMCCYGTKCHNIAVILTDQFHLQHFYLASQRILIYRRLIQTICHSVSHPIIALPIISQSVAQLIPEFQVRLALGICIVNWKKNSRTQSEASLLSPPCN